MALQYAPIPHLGMIFVYEEVTFGFGRRIGTIVKECNRYVYKPIHDYGDPNSYRVTLKAIKNYIEKTYELKRSKTNNDREARCSKTGRKPA